MGGSKTLHLVKHFLPILPEIENPPGAVSRHTSLSRFPKNIPFFFPVPVPNPKPTPLLPPFLYSTSTPNPPLPPLPAPPPRVPWVLVLRRVRACNLSFPIHFRERLVATKSTFETFRLAFEQFFLRFLPPESPRQILLRHRVLIT